MSIEWSPLALEDRDQIFDYIAAENPLAAIAVDERISAQIGRLRQFPESGRPGRVERTRELVIAATPYIAVYQLDSNRILVLRILHGSQQWPDGPAAG